MGPGKGIRRSPNVVWRRETKGGKTDGALLFSYETRKVHFLEGVGKFIWEECNGQSLDDMMQAIGSGSDRDEVKTFLRELEERGLVILD